MAAAKSAVPKNIISSPFLGELLAKRSIYIKVRPAPQNLSQRRAILKVLKQHGKIEVFKALGEPHSFISVTSDTTTAQNLILKAPLELSYGSTTATAPDQNPPSSAPSDTQEGSSQSQKFFIDIFEASTHPHKRSASKHAPLAGPWKTGANITSWPNDLALTTTVPGLTDNHNPNYRAEPHEDEDLLKSFARRHLERSYQDGRVDLGWKGLTDWESCGQGGGVYREDGETFEGGWRERVLRERWNGRTKGVLGLVGGDKDGGEVQEGEGGEGGRIVGEKEEKVKLRWVVGGGGTGKGEGKKDELRVGPVVEGGRRWEVRERSGLVLGGSEVARGR